MRGDIVHSVYGVHDGRAEDVYFGTYRTVQEAEAQVDRLRTDRGGDWAREYHNKGFAIRAVKVEIDFEFPSLPKPRDRYFVTGTPKANRPGTWDSTVVKVFRRGTSPSDLVLVCEFERNYSLLQTFEPFRKGGRDYALISRKYSKTAVIDLTTGQVVAEEVENTQGEGFCPVGFYVPDWWDVHDDSVIPGSPHWDSDNEWPTVPFGFVWGCRWGDDSSWKVQHLDLSEIEQGKIKRSERFGYLELATSGYRSPCFALEHELSGKTSKPPPFISISQWKGTSQVTFEVEMQFDLDSGACSGWKRTKLPFDD